MASKNCSLQEWVPITKAKFVFLMSLSTVFWGWKGGEDVTAGDHPRGSREGLGLGAHAACSGVCNLPHPGAVLGG